MKKSCFSKERNEAGDLNPIKDNLIYKILIVDDHTFIRSSLKINLEKILREENVKNIEITEGRDGVDIINSIIKDQEQNNLIKCVFSDENMEYINGSEAAKILKDLENRRKIKPITIASNTCHDNEDTKNVLKKAGEGQSVLP